jgi:hypothetical protein
MSSDRRDEQLHRRAVESVREAYDMADRMRKVNLDAVNGPRPPAMRYHAQHEIVREFITQANGMLELAGELGLIDADEGAALRREHPDKWQWMENEDARLSYEP